MQEPEGEEKEMQLALSGLRDSPTVSGKAAASACGFTYLKQRGEQMKRERQQLWASLSNPEELQRLVLACFTSPLLH